MGIFTNIYSTNLRRAYPLLTGGVLFNFLNTEALNGRVTDAFY